MQRGRALVVGREVIVLHARAVGLDRTVDGPWRSEVYGEAADYARGRGIIIADTKFEFGRDKDDEIILIDEVLTPDSSRFWPIDSYEVGMSQPSFDKQYVRDYLESIKWDKQPPCPELPGEIAQATTARYLEAFELITGESL